MTGAPSGTGTPEGPGPEGPGLAELADLLPPRYRDLQPVGQGAMGTVVSALDTELGRRVALKLLSGAPGPDAERRFGREALALSRVHHLAIVRIFDVGTTRLGPFLSMELLSGETLEKAAPDRSEDRMLAVAEGLEEVHRAGLVHRDLKPANLMAVGERTVIVDFGLALVVDRTRLTRPGVVVGTVAFMAPEVLAGFPATPASDWYSWGATFYWLVERRHPFSMADLLAAADRRVLPVPVFRRVEPGSPLAELLTAALRAEPGRRPGGLAAIREILGKAGSRAPSGPATVPEGLPSVGSRESRTIPGRVGPRLRGMLALGGVAGLAALLAQVREPARSRAGSEAGSDRGGGDEARLAAFPVDLEARLEEELAALARVRFDPAEHGFAEEAPPGAERALLGPDPALYRIQLGRLGCLRAGLVRLAGGPPPEGLEGVMEERLAGVDRRLEARGILPFFAAWASLRAMPPGPRPGFLEEPGLAGLEVPGEVGGWFRTALVELAGAIREVEVAEARRQTPEGRAELSLPVWDAATVAPETSLLELVRGLSAWAPARIDYARWLWPGSLRLRRALLAAGRCLAGEPEVAELMALVLVGLEGRISLLWFGPLGTLEPELLLGASIDTPAAALVSGWLVRASGTVRRRMGTHPGLDPVAGARGYFQQASRRPGPGAGGWARRRAGLGLYFLARASPGPEQAAELLQAREAELRELDPDLRELAMAALSTNAAPSPPVTTERGGGLGQAPAGRPASEAGSGGPTR